MAPVRTILHLDMDAFYASVEQHDHPEYRGKPVVVGAPPEGGSGRGVVATCSYEARRFGIHSAMPVSKAYRLCPQAIFVPPRFRRYVEISEIVFSIMKEFSPAIETLSLDEAYLDLTASLELFGNPEGIGREIKERILKTTGLTSSVGIASNKFVAKTASEKNKPDGLCICPAGKEKEFLAPLPVRAIRGIGKKTALELNLLAIQTAADLAEQDPAFLKRRFGKSGEHLWNLANGIDDSPVQSSERKSIGQEETFHEDTRDADFINRTFINIADRVSHSMRKKNIRGKTVVLKVRFSDFTTFTRKKTLPVYTNSSESIMEIVRELSREFSKEERAIRLLGITMT